LSPAGVERRTWPLSGIGIVWRRQMRGRVLRQDLLWAALMLAGLLVLSWGLQQVWLQGGTVGAFAESALRRWQITAGAVAALLFPALAAFSGASAMPTAAEVEATQAILLTRLRPFDIVVGRLLAALWPILLAITLSSVFWFATQAVWHLPGGIGAILRLHFVVLSAVYLMGTVGALCAVRRGPGRAWGRGVSVALIVMLGCTLTILLADQQIRRMDDPHRLIEAALLINPVAGATTALQLDLLRAPWLYEHSAAPEYEFAYPAPMATAGLFCACGLLALFATALRLRHALMRS
jgi:hypothetical protein